MFTSKQSGMITIFNSIFFCWSCFDSKQDAIKFGRREAVVYGEDYKHYLVYKVYELFNYQKNLSKAFTPHIVFFLKRNEKSGFLEYKTACSICEIIASKNPNSHLYSIEFINTHKHVKPFKEWKTLLENRILL